MTEKVTKSSVDYRPGGNWRYCYTCIMYHKPEGKQLSGTCDLVEGKIAPEYVCDKWEPMKDEPRR